MVAEMESASSDFIQKVRDKIQGQQGEDSTQVKNYLVELMVGDVGV